MPNAVGRRKRLKTGEIDLPRRKTTTTQGMPYFLTPECEITFEAGSAE
ncbi:hypothetical protein [Rhizobium leguminosarum]|uniref:Uncharacterized protein n=2 Tax=Rhizobium leguminosarum TaxID=384 RepID=A0A6P0DGA9_RHILE|nr:hypothetical protein [Rhizobium leguminosarum]MBB4353848.1 hypothetical protein [Rhizobium leguminosarum]MBB5258291.1 hypothetical protein [Rhizobium leguminosarum]MBY5484796.1 hypothetical protein [Rhizobium leguminosarum]MDX6003668.1 hypothetical protein [Rhizobium leguminosarum]NEK50546.1 hypothetical protein [Rhizobium leguminosarum]